MHWTHIEKGQDTMKELFGADTYTGNNPFYAFREISEKILADQTKPLSGEREIGAGYTNQMFALRIRKNTYKLYLGYVMSYRTGTQNSAYALVECMYNSETGKITQIFGSYALGNYSNTTVSMALRRTGTPETLNREICTFMRGRLTEVVEYYKRGVREYYANRPMCGHPD